MRKGKIRITKNRKVLLENFIFLGLLQVMRYLIPILVLPYVSRIIGVEHFGEIAITASVTMIMQYIVDYGYNFIGAREVAKNKTNITFITDLYSSITIARCLLFLACIIVVYILTLIFPLLAQVRLLLFITCPSVLLSVFIPEWLYQGLEEMKFITVIHVVSRIVYVALIFIFIRQSDDYIYYPLVNNIGFLFAGIASFIILRKKNILLHTVNWRNLWNILQDGWNLFINSLCAGLFAQLLNIFIGNFLSIRDSGIYNSASRLIFAARHGLNIITRVFFPFLAQHINKHKKFFIMNALIGLSAALFTFIFAPLIFRFFYPAEFSEGILIMRIMAIGLFFTGINNSLSANYLVLVKKEKFVRNMGFFTLFGGSIIFLLGIHLYGLLGATISSVTIIILNTIAFSAYTLKVKRQMSNENENITN